MKSKLSLIVTLALVGVVVFATITLGVLKVDYSPKFEQIINTVEIIKSEESDKIVVTKTSLDKTIYNQTINLYNSSFKQSILASFFSGNINTKPVIEAKSGNYKTRLNSGTGHKLYLILPNNGVIIKESSANVEHKITELSLLVEEKEGFSTIKIYGKIVDRENSYLDITTKTNIKQLYDYIAGLES